jgi:hypothetical protein
LFIGSLDGVELVGSLDGVDPCVEPNLILFASFYVLSILLSIENFDASSHFDLDLSQPKFCFFYCNMNLFFLCHILNLYFFCCILKKIVGNNIANLDDVFPIDFATDVLLKSYFMNINEK